MSQPPDRSLLIVKTPVLQRLDELCRDPLKRGALRADLEDSRQDYLEILVRHGAAKEYEAAHLRMHWYSRDTGWWRDEPTEAIVRRSLIKAIELATRDPTSGEERAQPLNIDSYWVLVGNQFEVTVVCSGMQVTRLLFAPSPPIDPRTFLAGSAPIWVVKRRSGSEMPGDDRAADVVEDVDETNEIVTVRLKGFPVDI
jgi:hypothetical protein